VRWKRWGEIGRVVNNHADAFADPSMRLAPRSGPARVPP
jgi:hypothetical protein